MATDSWVVNTWEFLDTCSIRFTPATATLSRRRIADKFLMGDCWPSSLPPETRQSLNRCRLYKQVVTLADLRLGDNVSMDPTALQKSRNPRSVPGARLRWPNQGLLSPSDWALWTHHVRLLFTRAKTLATPLGFWSSATSAPGAFRYSPALTRYMI